MAALAVSCLMLLGGAFAVGRGLRRVLQRRR